jgi:VPDSG-CTERM motif
MMKTFALLLSFLVAASAAFGNSIVYDDFGPGNTYQQSAGPDVGGSFHFEIAAGFVAGASGNLATVDLGLTFHTVPIAVNVFLYSDTSGSPDNASQVLLGSAIPTAQEGSSNNSIVSFTVAGSVSVTMGTSYWLVLKPAAPGNSADVWNYSFSPGNLDTSTDDSTWHPLFESNEPAFRLTAYSAVPDGGSTVLLLAIALAGLCVCARERVAA